MVANKRVARSGDYLRAGRSAYRVARDRRGLSARCRHRRATTRARRAQQRSRWPLSPNTSTASHTLHSPSRACKRQYQGPCCVRASNANVCSLSGTSTSLGMTLCRTSVRIPTTRNIAIHNAPDSRARFTVTYRTSRPAHRPRARSSATASPHSRTPAS